MNSGGKPPKSDSTVGYCKPPKHTRFRKGQSGNPKGRPQGTLNIATVLQRALRQKVVIYHNGKAKTVTQLEAAVDQLLAKAIGGDVKALRQLWTLMGSVEEREAQAPVPNSVLDEVDQKIVLGIMKRFENTNNEDPPKEGQQK